MPDAVTGGEVIHQDLRAIGKIKSRRISAAVPSAGPDLGDVALPRSEAADRLGKNARGTFDTALAESSPGAVHLDSIDEVRSARLIGAGNSLSAGIGERPASDNITVLIRVANAAIINIRLEAGIDDRNAGEAGVNGGGKETGSGECEEDAAHVGKKGHGNIAEELTDWRVIGQFPRQIISGPGPKA